MVRIGTAGRPTGSKDYPDAFRRLRQAGLEAMEVQFVRGVRMGDEQAVAVGRHAADNGIALSVHAPYYVNFNSESRETRARSVSWVAESLRLAELMAASVVVVHAASYGKREGATAAVIDGLRAVRDEAGSTSASIGLETMGKKGSWGTFYEIAEAAAAVDGVVPVMDFAHLHARGGGSLRSTDDFIAAIGRCRSIGGRDPHCHCSGIEFGERGERRHLPLASGDPDYRLLAQAKEHLGKDAVLIVESPSPLDDAVMLRSML